MLVKEEIKENLLEQKKKIEEARTKKPVVEEKKGTNFVY